MQPQAPEILHRAPDDRRTGARIFAAEEVLDHAGVESDRADDEETVDEERLSIFRDFVNSLDVEPGLSEPREGPPLE